MPVRNLGNKQDKISPGKILFKTNQGKEVAINFLLKGNSSENFGSITFTS